MSKLVRFAKDESGATAIEYGILAVGIGLAILAGTTALSTGLNNMFTGIAGKLTVQ